MIEELTLEVSHECPLNCAFCSSKNSVFGIKPGDKLDSAYVEKAIRKFSPKTVRWSGGEPFIYLNKKMLGKIRSFFPSTRQIVTTNGMYPDKAGELSDYFSEIRISVFGNERTHEKITGMPGSWKKAVRTLEKLKAKIGPDKKTKILITSPYISKSQIREVKAIAEDFKIGTRITGLVPSKSLSRPNGIVKSSACSLGGGNCLYYEKILILPNKKIIHCAAEKADFKCPFYLKN